MDVKINWDKFSILMSVLCAFHCIALPLIVTALPVFGVNIIHNVGFEWGMILLAFFVGVYALWHGYKLHHFQTLPLRLFSAGIILLVLKQLFHSVEIYLLIPAVILITGAHFLNIRMWRKNKKPMAY